MKPAAILTTAPKGYKLSGEIKWVKLQSATKGIFVRFLVQKYTLLTEPDVWVKASEVEIEE